MHKPQISSKITGAMPHCAGPNKVPSSGVEDNSFANRTKFPKDKEILSKDTMGNKALIEKSSPGRKPPVDKAFLNKHTNDMTASKHGL